MLHLPVFRDKRAKFAILTLTGFLSSCQLMSPSQGSSVGQKASFSIGLDQAVQNIVSKSNTTWQDNLFHFAGIDQKRAAILSKYKVQASAGAIAATVTLPAGAVSSSAPAYLHQSYGYPGPTPQAGDYLFVISDSGTLYKLNATTLAVVGSLGGLGAFSGGAVLLSSDNSLAYVLSTTGKLQAISTSTMTVRFSATVSGTGFSKVAPFIDYMESTVGSGAHDTIFTVANNGVITKTVLNVESATALATTTFNPTYAAAPTVNAFPIVWNGQAFFGDTAGNFYHVDCMGGTTPAPTSWNLAQYTSASGSSHAITTAPAFDVNAGGTVTKVFVPCGDRLDWIDPVANTVTPSNPLILDKTPTAPYTGTLAGWTPVSTAVKSYTDTDYISIKTVNSNPTSWGNTALSLFSNGVQGTSVKFAPSDLAGAGEIWTASNYNAGANPPAPAGFSQSYGLNLGGSVANTTNTPAGCNEVCIDKSTTDGTQGYVWAACTTANKLIKINPATGAIVATCTPTSGSGALWPECDSAGNVYVTCSGPSLNSNWVFSYTSTGALRWSKKIGTAPMAIAIDSSDDIWITDFSGNTLYEYNTAGTQLNSYATNANPCYVSIDPITSDPWIACNGANTVQTMNRALNKINKTYTVPANVWAINFDLSGNPYTCHLGTSAQVNKLNPSTGAIVTTYNFASPVNYSNCYESCWDSNGNGWVGTDGGIVEIFNLGNLMDIFGGPSFASSGDGDQSYGLFKFKIPLNNLGNYPVYSANVQLTAAATPASAQTVDMFTASVYQGGSTTTLWTGYPGTANINYNNRPTVTGPVSTTANCPMTLNTAYAFSVPSLGLSDQINSPDTSNAQFAYGVQNQANPLSAVGHWYSNKSGSTAAQYPTLQVTIANTAKFPANGIASQPVIDGSGKVYVTCCNLLWQLDCSSANNFQNPANTIYNATQSGRTYGPYNTTSSTFIFPEMNILGVPEAGGTRYICADYNPTTPSMVLNDFAGPLNGTLDALSYQVSAPAGTSSIGQQMLFDFNTSSGCAYMTTNTGVVVRAQILQ